jgi:exosortase
MVLTTGRAGMKIRNSNDWLPFVGWVALWVPAMIAASYEWGHGDYYDYGWFVPPAALWLASQRWQRTEGPVKLPSRLVVTAAFVGLVPWFLMLRVLGHVDPSWRLPMGVAGVTAVCASHGLIFLTRGGSVSRAYLWITLLCLSALPWPTVVETGFVHQLTQGVITAVVEVFHLIGKPVEAMGDRLRLHDITVEVTDGCSGIRSFQSFVMATWFFAELQRLSLGRAIVLLGIACAVAFGVNAARTFALATIRFSHGQEAFERAHDGLGLAAFVVSGLVFYWVSGTLGSKSAGKVVRTIQRRT